MITSKLKMTLAVAGLTGFVLASPAAAEEMMSNYYVGVSGLGSAVSDVEFDNNRGGTKHTADFDLGYGALLRGGYDFDGIRAELEAGYRNVDVDSVDSNTNPGGDVNLYTIMANVAWDIDIDSDVTPYLSLGLGAAFAEGDIAYDIAGQVRETKNIFGVAPAGQIGVGLGYALTDSASLVGGYSLLAAPTDDTNESETILIHSVQVGLNFSF